MLRGFDASEAPCNGRLEKITAHEFYRRGRPPKGEPKYFQEKVDVLARYAVVLCDRCPLQERCLDEAAGLTREFPKSTVFLLGGELFAAGRQLEDDANEAFQARKAEIAA